MDNNSVGIVLFSVTTGRSFLKIFVKGIII